MSIITVVKKEQNDAINRSLHTTTSTITTNTGAINTSNTSSSSTSAESIIANHSDHARLVEDKIVAYATRYHTRYKHCVERQLQGHRYMTPSDSPMVVRNISEIARVAVEIEQIIAGQRARSSSSSASSSLGNVVVTDPHMVGVCLQRFFGKDAMDRAKASDVAAGSVDHGVGWPAVASTDTVDIVNDDEAQNLKNQQGLFMVISSSEPDAMRCLLNDRETTSWLHIQRLPIGDVVLFRGEQPVWCKERKTVSDLDVRYEDFKVQRIRMIDTFVNHPRTPIASSRLGLILEHSDTHMSKMSAMTMQSVLSDTEHCYDIHTSRTSDLLHTILCLFYDFRTILRHNVSIDSVTGTPTFPLMEQERQHALLQHVQPLKRELNKKLKYATMANKGKGKELGVASNYTSHEHIMAAQLSFFNGVSPEAGYALARRFQSVQGLQMALKQRNEESKLVWDEKQSTMKAKEDTKKNKKKPASTKALKPPDGPETLLLEVLFTNRPTTSSIKAAARTVATKGAKRKASDINTSNIRLKVEGDDDEDVNEEPAAKKQSKLTRPVAKAIAEFYLDTAGVGAETHDDNSVTTNTTSTKVPTSLKPSAKTSATTTSKKTVKTTLPMKTKTNT